jgi:hypothetical protein
MPRPDTAQDFGEYGMDGVDCCTAQLWIARDPARAPSTGRRCGHSRCASSQTSSPRSNNSGIHTARDLYIHLVWEPAPDDWSAAPSALYLQRPCVYRTAGSLKDRAANGKFPCCT